MTQLPDYSLLNRKYREAGSMSLRTTGVHHLSKSSCETLLECTQKFYYKSSIKTAKPELTLGTVGHALQEHIAALLKPAADKYLNGEITREELDRVFPEFREAVLDQLDIPLKIMEYTQAEYNEQINSSIEIIMPGGPGAYRTELLSLAETMGKSLKREHVSQMFDLPPAHTEMPVVYFPEGMTIPYMGYIDLLKVASDGLLVSDLKFTFSNNSYVWNSAMTPFQLWLYSASLVQMGVCTEMPRAEITRVVVDIGKKRKVRPTTFDVKVERKRLKPMKLLDSRYMDSIRTAEAMILSGVELFANSTFGCKSCDYYEMCPKKSVPDWEVEDGQETSE